MTCIIPSVNLGDGWKMGKLGKMTYSSLLLPKEKETVNLGKLIGYNVAPSMNHRNSCYHRTL